MTLLHRLTLTSPISPTYLRFYKPLPQLIPGISETTLTADYYNQLCE